MIDLAALSYRKSEPDGLWLPTAPREAFGYCDGPEEQEVRRAIADAADRSTFSRDLAGRITGWVTRYHLSPARSGLLRPVLGAIRGEVLEIGAGFGAITRALGEAGHSVTAIEGSPFRAGAAALRCADLPGVQVACDDAANLPGHVRFDTIVMIGVLEYARAHFGSNAADAPGDAKDPVDRMLASIAAMLRPGGRLVLAIENQLGLKYFAGYPEDHLNEPFVGIEDRYAADGPVTFGRRELAARLADAGLGRQRWLYPFPDYKLPSVILTDRATGPEPGFDAAPLIAQAVRRDAQRPVAPPFSVGAAWGPLARNGLVPELAHSFLVVASNKPVPAPEALAHYLALDRPPPHGKAVRFVETEGGIVAETQTAEGALVRTDPYRAGALWHDRLAALVLRPGWTVEQAADWAATWWNAVTALAREDGAAASGLAAGTLLPSRLIDAIPRNLIVGKDGPGFIDLEWSIASPIEAGYLFHRGIRITLEALEFCAAPAPGTPLDIDELAMQLAFAAGLWTTRADTLRYKDFERQFQSHVEGTGGSPHEPAFGGEPIPVRLPFARSRDLETDLAERARRTTELERHAANLEQHAANLERQVRGAEAAAAEQAQGWSVLEAEHRRHAANLEEKARTAEAAVAEYTRHAANLEHVLQAVRHEGAAAALHHQGAAREGRAHAERLEAMLAEHRRHAANLEDKARDLEDRLAEQTRHAAELERGLHAADLREAAQSEQLAQQVSALDGTIASQAAEIRARGEAIDHLHAVIDQHRRQHEAAMDRIREAEEELDLLRRRLRRLHASVSWRVTAPYRATYQSLRRLAGGAAKPPAAPPPQPPAPPAAEPTAIGATGPARSPEAELIAASGLFDETGYAGAGEARTAGIDPIDHYLRTGEAGGLRPSPGFDPGFYGRRHPDIAASGMNRFLHYVADGRREGRLGLPAAESLAYPDGNLQPHRRTVLVLVHEATRTGAAILGWNIATELAQRYNVVTLLKRGGPIAPAIERASGATVTLPDDFVLDEDEIPALANRLAAHYAPLYAIANSAETRYFVPALERAGIPVVALIHEFSASIRPLDAMYPLFGSASKLVFSARLTAESFLDDYVTLVARTYEVLPQGSSRLPAEPAAETLEIARAGAAKPSARFAALRATTTLADLPGDDTFLVIGVGTITMRKGVDFFIAAAAAALRDAGATKLAFAWVGQAYRFDQFYVDFLEEQVRRSGIEASFHFLGEFEDLDPVYARAGALLLSSRLDPLPNVGIDAIVRGLPVVCFAEASGIAEMLGDAPELRDLVVPHLDAAAAAATILALARAPQRRVALAESLRAFARRHFDMAQYVGKLDQLGRDAAAAAGRRARDRDAILSRNGFNRRLHLGPRAGAFTDAGAVEHYLHASQLAAPRNRPLTGRLLRRPLEGFNPLVYAGDNPGYDEAAGEDPLAHYLRAGRPEGRWTHRVIRPSLAVGAGMGTGMAEAPNGRIAVHGHFHYPELIDDFLLRLRANRTAFDLFLTATDETAASFLHERIAALGQDRAFVAVVPNRGRDIGPMLTGPTAERLAGYDLVGHFHGKRSVHIDPATGSGWRNFLWEHLIGARYPMMDAIVAAFAADPALGLVFPEDPHLNDWDQNRPFAEAFAARMGVALPNHFDFPQGTMFWARGAALRPLRELRLDWDDYMPEPLPIDGTKLHALERLLPFAAEAAGLRYATTHVPEFAR